jgi:hypothetical protein
MQFLFSVRNEGLCIHFMFRADNGTLLIVYPIRIVSDKMGMGKILFSLGYRIWIRKKLINLSGMDISKGFSLSVIQWVNYI